MKIVEEQVELKESNDYINHIAECARICYASTKVNNNKHFVNSLWNNDHRSMFRHEGVYYITPIMPVSWYKCKDLDYVYRNGLYYISTNLQCAREHLYDIKHHEIPFERAENEEVFYKYKLLRYTFIIDTSIAMTREFNRKSPNNIAEQSTRYVDFNKKVGIRFLKSHWMKHLNRYKKCLTWFMFKCSEWFYKIARSKYGLNLPPEDARCFLPLNTMSKVAYTYTIRDWERIINMRLWDWTGKAHNDAKTIADYIYNELSELGYNIEKYGKD